jgi:ribosome-binding factor A
MYRIKKIEVDLKREISFIINNKIKDPRVSFVTLTDVKLSPDFKHLNVFFSIMGQEREIEEGIAGLNNSKGYITKSLLGRVELRTVPKISFIYDRSIDNGLRISKIIDGLKQRRQIRCHSLKYEENLSKIFETVSKNRCFFTDIPCIS